jgi:hypothetical protein
MMMHFANSSFVCVALVSVKRKCFLRHEIAYHKQTKSALNVRLFSNFYSNNLQAKLKAAVDNRKFFLEVIASRAVLCVFI